MSGWLIRIRIRMYPQSDLLIWKYPQSGRLIRIRIWMYPQSDLLIWKYPQSGRLIRIRIRMYPQSDLMIRKYPQSGQLIWICIQLYPQSFVFIVVVFVVIFSLSLSSSSLSSLLGRHLMGPTVIFAREILAVVKLTTWLRQFSSNQCLMLLFRHSFTTCLEKQCLSLWQSRCSILWVEEGASPSGNS